MYRQLCYRSALVLVLLSLYCNSSPVDKNHQQPLLSLSVINEPLEPMDLPVSKRNNDISSSKLVPEFYYLKILCARYGACNDDDENVTDYGDTKRKRLSASLFHGFPKFGKRAFSSAFSGLPKFG